MGQVNPAKQVHFIIEANGLNQFICQDLTLPDKSIGEGEHTEGVLVVKTPGRVTIGSMTLSNLVPTDQTEDWAYTWFSQVYNTRTAQGGTPSDYLRTLVVRVQDGAGNNIKSYELVDCWVKKVGGVQLSKGSDDNVIEEIELVVGDWDIIQG